MMSGRGEVHHSDAAADGQAVVVRECVLRLDRVDETSFNTALGSQNPVEVVQVEEHQRHEEVEEKLRAPSANSGKSKTVKIRKNLMKSSKKPPKRKAVLSLKFLFGKRKDRIEKTMNKTGDASQHKIGKEHSDISEATEERDRDVSNELTCLGTESDEIPNEEVLHKRDLTGIEVAHLKEIGIHRSPCSTVLMDDAKSAAKTCHAIMNRVVIDSKSEKLETRKVSTEQVIKKTDKKLKLESEGTRSDMTKITWEEPGGVSDELEDENSRTLQTANVNEKTNVDTDVAVGSDELNEQKVIPDSSSNDSSDSDCVFTGVSERSRLRPRKKIRHYSKTYGIVDKPKPRPRPEVRKCSVVLNRCDDVLPVDEDDGNVEVKIEYAFELGMDESVIDRNKVDDPDATGKDEIGRKVECESSVNFEESNRSRRESGNIFSSLKDYVDSDVLKQQIMDEVRSEASGKVSKVENVSDEGVKKAELVKEVRDVDIDADEEDNLDDVEETDEAVNEQTADEEGNLDDVEETDEAVNEKTADEEGNLDDVEETDEAMNEQTAYEEEKEKCRNDDDDGIEEARTPVIEEVKVEIEVQNSDDDNYDDFGDVSDLDNGDETRRRGAENPEPQMEEGNNDDDSCGDEGDDEERGTGSEHATEEIEERNNDDKLIGDVTNTAEVLTKKLKLKNRKDKNMEKKTSVDNTVMSDADDMDDKCRPRKGSSGRSRNAKRNLQHGKNSKNSSSVNAKEKSINTENCDVNQEIPPKPKRSSFVYTTDNFRGYCEICNFKLLTITSYQKHLLAHHSDAAPFTCMKCDRNAFSFGGLRTHIYMNHAKIITNYVGCRRCNVGIGDRSTLEKHLREVHGFRLPLTCPVCQKLFDTNKSIKAHMESQHSQYRKKVMKPVKTKCSIPKPKSNVIAEKKNVSAVKLYRYRHDKFDGTCDICGVELKGILNYQLHLRATHIKHAPYTCVLCEESFFSIDGLWTHVNVLHGTMKKVGCRNCNEIFEDREQLEDHVSKKHEWIEKSSENELNQSESAVISTKDTARKLRSSDRVKPRLVDEGNKEKVTSKGRKSGNPRKRNRDSRESPSNETQSENKKPRWLKDSVGQFSIADDVGIPVLRKERLSLMCQNCSKVFTIYSDFNLHLEEHDTVNKCELCNIKFKKEAALFSHQLRAHSDTIVFNNKCRICGNLFPTFESLKDHQKLHDSTTADSVQCGFCDRVMNYESDLSKHIEEVHMSSVSSELQRASASPPPLEKVASLRSEGDLTMSSPIVGAVSQSTPVPAASLPTVGPIYTPISDDEETSALPVRSSTGFLLSNVVPPLSFLAINVLRRIIPVDLLKAFVPRSEPVEIEETDVIDAEERTPSGLDPESPRPEPVELVERVQSLTLAQEGHTRNGQEHGELSTCENDGLCKDQFDCHDGQGCDVQTEAGNGEPVGVSEFNTTKTEGRDEQSHESGHIECQASSKSNEPYDDQNTERGAACGQKFSSEPKSPEDDALFDQTALSAITECRDRFGCKDNLHCDKPTKIGGYGNPDHSQYEVVANRTEQNDSPDVQIVHELIDSDDDCLVSRKINFQTSAASSNSRNSERSTRSVVQDSERHYRVQSADKVSQYLPASCSVQRGGNIQPTVNSHVMTIPIVSENSCAVTGLNNQACVRTSNSMVYPQTSGHVSSSHIYQSEATHSHPVIQSDVRNDQMYHSQPHNDQIVFHHHHSSHFQAPSLNTANHLPYTSIGHSNMNILSHENQYYPGQQASVQTTQPAFPSYASPSHHDMYEQRSDGLPVFSHFTDSAFHHVSSDRSSFGSATTYTSNDYGYPTHPSSYETRPNPMYNVTSYPTLQSPHHWNSGSPNPQSMNR